MKRTYAQWSFGGTILGAAFLLAQVGAAQESASSNELRFSSKCAALRPGDCWSYTLSSSRKSLDGQVLKITFTNHSEEGIRFALQLGDAAPQQCVVSKHDASFVTPIESANSNFTLVGIGEEYPSSLTKGENWQKNHLLYSYDAMNQRTTTGYTIAGSGPVSVAVPSGTFPCARLEYVDAGTRRLSSMRWFTPDLPMVVRSRERLAGSSGIVLFEMSSFTVVGHKASLAESNIDIRERQNAIDWIKLHNKFGEECQLVDDFILTLHTGIRESPSKVLRWLIGSRLTRDSKAYRLEWKAGKFSHSESTERESDSNQVNFSVGE